MGKVLGIWLIQVAVVVWIAFSTADVGGFMSRVRQVFRSRQVWALFAGCLAFLWSSYASARDYDAGGASLGFVSFCVEGLLLLGAIVAILFRRAFGAAAIDLTFGSAKFATPAHAEARGLLGESGIRLGFLQDVEPGDAPPLAPDSHALHIPASGTC